MPGVVTEPFPAVVVKVVVHLVAEGGRIVVDLYEIARQIDPLSAGVVSIDEYLVSGTLPVLLLSWFVGKSYLQEKFFFITYTFSLILSDVFCIVHIMDKRLPS